MTLRIGNRGQRIPEWHLDPIKNQFTCSLLKKVGDVDSWQLYRVLTQACERLSGQTPIGVVREDNVDEVIAIVNDLLNFSTPQINAA